MIKNAGERSAAGLRFMECKAKGKLTRVPTHPSQGWECPLCQRGPDDGVRRQGWKWGTLGCGQLACMVGLSWLGVEEMKREPSAATDSQAQLQSQARYK